jgi:hypothetical protein
MDLDMERYNGVERRAQYRPPIAAEVRAWISVGVVLAVQIVGGVWWAATLSAQNAGMRDLLVQLRTEMKEYALKSDVERRFDEKNRVLLDHESRLRSVEATKGKR